MENQLRTVSLINPLKEVRVECVGRGFINFCAKQHTGEGVIHHSVDSEKTSDQDLDIEIDVDYLRSLDPKEWKDQDHYHVLGLKNLRNKATDDDLKRAFRKIVLKHHPDKRKGMGEEINSEDDYFTCITKAYETLGNPIKRKSYDSIDPEFDDSLPTSSEIEKDYFGVFTDQFARNSVWSEKKNVPVIGDYNSPRDHVDHFYSFWYNFESWREYSYLDEEDKDKGQDREERRWIEKQNRVIRVKRKKEEMTRIRSLVDLAYNNDPRISKFKQEEKDKKLAAKRAKLDVVQAQRAEEERIVKEAQMAKENAEKAEQKRIESIRMEREQQKRALKRERKTFRDNAKSNNYYTNDDKEKIKHMEGVEKICEMLKHLELQEFNKELTAGGKTVFKRVLKDTEDKLEEERKALFSNHKIQAPQTSANDNQNTLKASNRAAMWSPENMQLLIKAVNLFPAGTVQRWEVIANYMNQHSTDLKDKKFLSRDVLNKAKDIQSSDFSKNVLKTQANDNAFASFEKGKKELKVVDPSDPSILNEADENNSAAGAPKKKLSKSKQPAPAPVLNSTTDKEKEKSQEKKTNSSTKKTTTTNSKTTPIPEKKMNGTTEKPAATQKIEIEAEENILPATPIDKTTWSKDEQALLEQAIKTYPISTADRWEKIAECIPNRTKKECLRRVKELVDRVNAKREAQQGVK